MNAIEESLNELGAWAMVKVVAWPRVIDFWIKKGRVDAAVLRAVGLELPTANIMW